MNTFDFTTEIIGSVHMTVFEIVAPHNVDNWIQCYMTYVVDQSKQCDKDICKKIACCLNFAITKVFKKKLITEDMHVHKAYMYIEFQQN